MAGFCTLEVDLQAPDLATSRAKSPIVSAGYLKYSRFWETTTGDRVRSTLRGRRAGCIPGGASRPHSAAPSALVETLEKLSPLDPSARLNLGTNRRLRPLPIMDTVLSFVISAGIIAFGTTCRRFGVGHSSPGMRS